MRRHRRATWRVSATAPRVRPFAAPSEPLPADNQPQSRVGTEDRRRTLRPIHGINDRQGHRFCEPEQVRSANANSRTADLLRSRGWRTRVRSSASRFPRTTTESPSRRAGQRSDSARRAAACLARAPRYGWPGASRAAGGSSFHACECASGSRAIRRGETRGTGSPTSRAAISTRAMSGTERGSSAADRRRGHRRRKGRRGGASLTALRAADPLTSQSASPGSESAGRGPRRFLGRGSCLSFSWLEGEAGSAAGTCRRSGTAIRRR